MMDLDFLKQFIKQANTDSLKTKQYPKKFLDFFIKVSFGQGSLANIPWVAFRKTVSSGPYYPVYLFYIEEGKVNNKKETVSEVLIVSLKYTKRESLINYIRESSLTNKNVLGWIIVTNKFSF